MLPISDYAWPEQQFMQLVSTFAYVYLQGNEIKAKQVRQKKEEEEEETKIN